MNTEYFIAKRIHFQQGKKNVSRPAVRIAIAGIALGLAVMIIAVAVVIGFKQEIRNKTIGFGGHIQVTNFDSNNTYELQPVQADNALMDKLRGLTNVAHAQRFATKPGIIKTDDQFQGIVLKGVDKEFDWEFFRSNLTDGNIPDTKSDTLRNEIIISKQLAELLELKTGDSFFTYFIQEQVRARKFVISGIYSTNFAEYDKMFLITDLRHVQQLNNWDRSQYSGVEILIKNFDRLEETGNLVYAATSNRFDNEGNALYTQTIKQISPNIYGWLDLLDMNVWVILFLMLSVAGFNMISGLLILILERTNMIGILKSVGAQNWSIRKIFLYHSLFLIGKGMLLGNLAGLSLCTLQYFTHIIPLDPEAYYVSFVPVTFNWLYLILLNAGTLLASLLMMIGPSYLITKISPAKIIRYE